MNLLGHKIFVMVVGSAIKMLAGIIPIFLFKFLSSRQRKVLDQVVGATLCFGGGVLLSTVFLHILPEVQENFSHATELEYLPDSHFPIASACICAGFFIVYIIETLVHKLFHSRGGAHHSHGPLVATLPAAPDDGEGGPTKASSSTTEQVELEESVSSNGSYDGDRGAVNGGYEADEAKTKTRGDISFRFNSIFSESNAFSPNKKLSSDNVYNVSSATLTSYKSHGSDSVDTSLPTYLARPPKNNPQGTNDAPERTKDNTVLQTLRNVLIVMALSLHGVFEGMAIGLQLTVGDVWTLFGAVVCHSLPIHFCIGVDMLANRTKHLHVALYMAVMSTVTSLGVAVGMLVTEHAAADATGSQTVAIGVLQGISGGTLLYIAFYEVLERDRLVKGGMDGLIGCIFVLAGFLAMAAVEATGNGHSHVDFEPGGHSSHHEPHLHAGHHLHQDGALEQVDKALRQGENLYATDKERVKSDDHDVHHDVHLDHHESHGHDEDEDHDVHHDVHLDHHESHGHDEDEDDDHHHDGESEHEDNDDGHAEDHDHFHDDDTKHDGENNHFNEEEEDDEHDHQHEHEHEHGGDEDHN